MSNLKKAAEVSGQNSIRHLPISHNTPCLPPKFCIALSSISLGAAVIPGRNEKQRLRKTWGEGGANKVYYGICENGEWLGKLVSVNVTGNCNFPKTL